MRRQLAAADLARDSRFAGVTVEDRIRDPRVGALRSGPDGGSGSDSDEGTGPPGRLRGRPGLGYRFSSDCCCLDRRQHLRAIGIT